MPVEIISAAIGLLLTLMIFSYLIKDNALFRIAAYIFIGVASGYAAVVIIYDVFLPRLNALQTNNFYQQIFFGIIPLVLGLSVLAKVNVRAAWIGNFAMAILVGVGAATAIGGALLGSLIPQFQAATGVFDVSSAGSGLGIASKLFEGGVMLVGTVLTLAAFHFGTRRAADGTPKRNPIIEGAAWFGRLFIAITLGALFAGVYMASLTAMIERLSSMMADSSSIIHFIRQLFGF